MKLSRKTGTPVSATLALALVCTSTAFAGIYFESTNVTKQAEKKKGDELVVHAWVDGDSSKILFVAGENGLMQEDTYLLTNDGGDTLYLVNPKDETYFKWSLEDMFAGLGALMEGVGGMFSMDFSEA